LPSAAASFAIVGIGEDWLYAFGVPSARGRIRAKAEDFMVREDLGFEASGEGQHLLVHVRKRDANTQYVARELARMADVSPREVGYAGLKDRHAIAEQWFTIGLPSSKTQLDLGAGAQGFEILSVHPHHRKLRRGALARNRFELLITDLEGDRDEIEERLTTIRDRGVPNYFGYQRFGRDGSNLVSARHLLIEGGRIKRREERSFAYSAARSFLFNELLSFRIGAGVWDELVVGDLANLDGVGSIFPVEAIDDTLRRRSAELDIHPSGPLWGEGEPGTSGDPNAWEIEHCGSHPFSIPLAEHGLTQMRRALRLRVQNLEWSYEPQALRLAFALNSGAFATSVLREVARTEDCGTRDI
jgi:tRNA pseudouridine13 synthase